jgi:predicted PurR-regulated permease PerM
MLILSLSIFFITYISLTLLELIFDFDTGRTFTLALIGGVMEFIPYIGPILALIPALIIGLGISWQVALAIAILYLIIQQIENNLLVPYVMSRSLDLSPFLVFVVMIAGATLGGILGIILAVPVAAIVRVIYISYRKSRVRTPLAKTRAKSTKV